MRVLFPLIVLFAVSCRSVTLHGNSAVADGRLPVVYGESNGAIRLQSAHQTALIDLTSEIAGCTGQMYDPTTGEKWDSGVSLVILDVSQRNSLTYILLLASAAPNCNVQGLCGASETPDRTLLWLCISDGRTRIEQQRVVVESCSEARFPDIPEGDPQASLHFADGVLKISYEQLDPTGQAWEMTKGQVEYDRTHPEAGLKISGSPGG